MPLATAVVARRAVLAAALVAASAHALANPWSNRAGRTGFHGAIAYSAASDSIGYAYDFRTAREARVAALNQCADPACEVKIHVRNACAVVLADAGRIHTAKGATRSEAVTRGLRQCKAPDCREIAWVCTK